MGQTRDNGIGKQYGSHVDYKVRGELPVGFVGEAEEKWDLPIVRRLRNGMKLRLPRKYDKAEDWRGVVGGALLGIDVQEMWPTERQKGKIPRFPDVDCYLAELPDDVCIVVGWYLRFVEEGRRFKDLPEGYLSQISGLSRYYPAVRCAIEHALEARKWAQRAETMDYLMDYATDTEETVRSSAVRASGLVQEYAKAGNGAVGSAGIGAKGVKPSATGGNNPTVVVAAFSADSFKDVLKAMTGKNIPDRGHVVDSEGNDA